MILFCICLLQCVDSTACEKKKNYSWDFELDYPQEEDDYYKKEEQVEPNVPEQELVVTICDYDANDNLYCYDLP